jgi:hypothetical protein
VAKPLRPIDKKKKKERFPWLLFLALIGTIYLFWILPRQRGPQPVQVEFKSAETR